MTARLLCGLLVLGLATPTLADFSGKGELGLVFARGNSETETGNARFDLIYQEERWTNESNLSAVYARDSGETSANRFVLANKTDYSLDEESYVLGALRYDRDQFSTFRFQSTVSVGYGRKLIDTERHNLKAEIGPGFRFAEIRDTGESENEIIGRGFAEYAWTISETTTLTNRTLVESGSDNTFVENILGLTLAINSRLALQTGFTVRHNTDVDPARKKTDTLTTVNLVYNFGAK
ncbi:MAG: YdiY family protein [Wenzhouxiangella sp.]